MDKLLKMGPVILALRDFPVYSPYPFRDWKLDAFSTSQGTPDLWICYEKSPVEVTGEPVELERSVHSRRQLYSLTDGRMVWQQVSKNQLQLQLVVSADRTHIAVTADETDTFGMAVWESLTFLVFYLLLKKQVLTLHGAMVEADGKAIIFTGQSGVGKTTQARLWRDHKNALVLNGDRSCVYHDGSRWMGFGTPWCGTSGEYCNRQTPIGAVVVVEKDYVNQVEPLEGLARLQSIMPHGQIPFWGGELTEQALQLLDGFLAEIPVLRLRCKPDTQAVDVLAAYLENCQ